MAAQQNHSLELETSQSEAIASLKLALGHLVEKQRMMSYLGFNWASNMAGVFGPRGAGKSTVMIELYEQWYRSFFKEGPGAVTKRWPDSGDYFLIKPLDCSVLPDDVAPGTAVLINFYESLKEQDALIISDEELHELEELIHIYGRTSPRFHDLCLDLSGSAREFSEYLVGGIRDRLRLKEKLADWLEQLQRNNPHIKAFVVLLDDFDLVSKGLVRMWLKALLDELHQRKMLFVLTADFHRLEHLSWGAPEAFDERTGHAIINKLLPTENRISLEPWGFEALKHYPSDEDNLYDGLKAISEKLSIPFMLTHQLAPKIPRGVMQLHATLKQLPKLKDDCRNLPEIISKLLQMLAASRGESLLARHLFETPLYTWPRFLAFSIQPLVGSAWLELVQAAQERGKLSNHVASDQLYPLIKANFEAKGSYHEVVNGFLTMKPRDPGGGMSHDPTWGTPLRYDLLRSHPLKDANPEDQPFWTELLLGFGLRPLKKVASSAEHRCREDEARASRNKYHLLTQWVPLQQRFHESCFQLELVEEDIMRLFDFYPPLRQGFCWMDVSPHEGLYRASIGWKPLLTALKGERTFLLAEIRARLFISEGFEGDSPEVGSAQLLDILPDEVWAMVLLTEALSRCPWSSFHRTLNLNLTVYMGLAAAFTRTAYLYAMEKCDLISRQQMPMAQSLFLESLDARDLGTLEPIKANEDALIRQLDVLFQEDLHEYIQGSDSLSNAARAFLDSGSYKTMAAILEVMHEDIIEQSTPEPEPDTTAETTL